MATKLSNVIGAPFSDYVLRQLYTRAVRNSTVSRSNEEILFLANKTAWARLVSSVNIVLNGEELRNYYSKLGIDQTAGPTLSPESLAKNWILEAGTSIQNGNGITLREGIGPNGAYGLGGTEELGYRPVPGLTSVTVETVGRLGSLRQATINFKVWNMNQLNVIEALYFRLGYSMLLEWGHTQYFKNDNTFERSEIYGIGDPFVPGLRKETIQQSIAKKARQTSGNYDGMLGIVSNFNWVFNQDGGYDCTVRLIGLGAVMDSLRVNQIYTLPEGTLKEFKKNQSALQTAIEELRTARKAAEEAARKAEQKQVPEFPAPPKSIDELYEYARKLDNYLNTKQVFRETYQYYPTQTSFLRESNIVPDYYYASTAIGELDRVKYDKDYFGLFLQGGGTYWKRLPLESAFTLNAALIDRTARFAIDALEDRTRFFNLPNNSLTGRQFTQIGSLFYGQSGFRVDTVNQGTLAQRNVITDVALTDSFNKGEFAFIYPHTVGSGTSVVEKQFTTKVSFINFDSANYFVTRKQVLEAFDAWFSNPTSQLIFRRAQDRGSGTAQSIDVTANVDIIIPNAINVGINKTLPAVAPATLTFTFTFDNTSYIAEPGKTVENVLAEQQRAQQANQGDTNGALNQGDTSQVESTTGFESALHAMLVIVQTKAQSAALNIKDVLDVDITSETKTFFEAGSLAGALSATPPVPTDSNGVPFNVLDYGLKGYNTALMADPSLYREVPTVSFADLCKAYVVKYPQGSVEGTLDMVHSPVYIQLGYLLAFLNNMCLIYDSIEATNNTGQANPARKHPYIYIDFNPDTNFCLTSPQQLSVDPFTCLIPFNATLADYNSIFPENIKLEKPFDPQKQNIVTRALNSRGLKFKSDTNAYQGRTMNILLNVDYLLKLVKDYAGSDAEHAVKLQPFLEKIMFDINKCLGNVNAFRISYRDESNTIQIQDDQWVPNLTKPEGSESSILARKDYLTQLKTDPILSGQLPVFGTPDISITQQNQVRTLARQFQLRTVMSTKLASMIAISAQASTGSVNAKDHSSLSYLNKDFQDRYKPYIQNPSNGVPGSNTDSKDKVNTVSNDQKAAELFNTHIASIYSNLQLSGDKIEPSKNYYIERMSKVKAEDPVTTASPFIPVELDLTVDGISGIIMGNAFTIPEDRLPLSLRGEKGLAKLGFIVTGLSHTVEGNEWLTRIKGQPIKLRESSSLSLATATIQQAQTVLTAPISNAQAFNNTITTTPWSAAFISYVMREAGVDFPVSATHTGYAQSLRDVNRGFQVLNPATTVVQKGDIVLQNRDGSTLTFQTKPWTGFSHGDIITEINSGIAYGVGGNVSNTVYRSSFTLVNGRIASPSFFAVLRPPQQKVDVIIRAAIGEYNLWKNNNWSETTSAAFPTIATYYRIVGINV